MSPFADHGRKDPAMTLMTVLASDPFPNLAELSSVTLFNYESFFIYGVRMN